MRPKLWPLEPGAQPIGFLVGRAEFSMQFSDREGMGYFALEEEGQLLNPWMKTTMFSGPGRFFRKKGEMGEMKPFIS